MNYKWVRDFALFYAIKEYFNGASWMEWPDQDIRLRKTEAIEKYSKILSDEINYFIFEQYLFFRQWEPLHERYQKLDHQLKDRILQSCNEW